MIVTEGPTLEENLKRVTPWWDLATKYLVAAMMAIALTCIVVQVTKDNVVCVPAVDCSKLTVPNGSLTVNVSDDSAKLCQSLTSKSSKKTVLAKMVDRRLYDYVDSVCFQEMSWFTKFFPLLLLVEAVVLLGLDILWTKLPFSSSVLNHLVALTDECYSSLATIGIILGKTETQDRRGVGSDRYKYAIITEADALKVLNLLEKAEHFRREHETLNDQDMSSQNSNAQDDDTERANQTEHFIMGQETLDQGENDINPKKSLHRYYFYIMRTLFQIVICLASLVINLFDQKRFFEDFGKTFQFPCYIDEFVFAKEYDHFECSHPLAPYFNIAVIIFIIFLFLHLGISITAFFMVYNHGRSYTFPSKTSEGRTSSNNDFAFLFYLLTQHDKLYARRVSCFFVIEENLRTNVLNFMNARNNGPAGHPGPSRQTSST